MKTKPTNPIINPMAMKSAIAKLPNEELQKRLYDANLTIQALQGMASRALINEMELEDGLYHVYGKDAYLRFRKGIEFIFGKEYFPHIRIDAIDIAHAKLETQKREMENDMEEDLTLLYEDAFHVYEKMEEE